MTENPLTKEQMEELGKISQMPVEEQKKALPRFLKKLSPEQVEFLKKQQGGGCVYCAIAEGKIEAKKVYEDANLLGVLEINPANKGHVVLFPKKHYEILNKIEDVGHLFNVAKSISGAVFDGVKAEGTNIFISNGAAAGQLMPHVTVHIVPRFKDDKFSLRWDKVEVSDEDMDEVKQEIVSRLEAISDVEEEKEEKVKDVPKKKYSEKERVP
ncbi:MAG: HIT family protein [Candidatus Woesearchaeota archaeon]